MTNTPLLWCYAWGCRNYYRNINVPLKGCDLCGAVTCNEHPGLHWEMTHKKGE